MLCSLGRVLRETEGGRPDRAADAPGRPTASADGHLGYTQSASQESEGTRRQENVQDQEGVGRKRATLNSLARIT